ncbi:SET domain-containing protein 9 isoform X5 [Alligator sinensis]|uniref:SET domain-containing protein 9 isoform X5 n=1 Tax=Alligator sinensis TaxID=38654 RepID=A0A3Q0GBC1_ALLSI|nr:SET domain-containing protein 9 isoform X5 [Alligator sinensis]
MTSGTFPSASRDGGVTSGIGKRLPPSPLHSGCSLTRRSPRLGLTGDGLERSAPLTPYLSAETLRYVPEDCKDKIVSDEDVLETLLKIFKALFINDFTRQMNILALLPEVKSTYLELLHLQPSKSKITFSCYESTVYQKYEPIFFQSIGNPFIFRCIDGVLIDGNDKGISKAVYRSCSRRDQLGPFHMSDVSWLTPVVQNPLAVGQYVNNCSPDKAANVCYQEFDVPECFPIELKQYLPNVTYSHDIQSPLRCVVLVALRDIKQGEELFSNYYTIVN